MIVNDGFRLKRINTIEELLPTDYRGTEPLCVGRGSFSEVLRFDAPAGTGKGPLALKIIPCGDEGQVRAAEREMMMTLLARDTPGVVKLVNWGWTEKEGRIEFCLLEEYRTPLLSFLRETPVTPAEVLRRGAALCSVLAALRDRGILHLDIQPKNLFVDGNGGWLLGDFGCARRLRELPDGQLRGTKAYMAPEVWSRQLCSERSEICSLGLVLYCILNGGELPLSGLYSREEAVERRLDGREIPLLPGMPACVAKAAAPTPGERYASFEEFGAALRAEAEKREPYRSEEPPYPPVFAVRDNEGENSCADPPALRDLKRFTTELRENCERTAGLLKRMQEALASFNFRDGSIESVCFCGAEILRAVCELKRQYGELYRRLCEAADPCAAADSLSRQECSEVCRRLEGAMVILSDAEPRATALYRLLEKVRGEKRLPGILFSSRLKDGMQAVQEADSRLRSALWPLFSEAETLADLINRLELLRRENMASAAPPSFSDSAACGDSGPQGSVSGEGFFDFDEEPFASTCAITPPQSPDSAACGGSGPQGSVSAEGFCDFDEEPFASTCLLTPSAPRASSDDTVRPSAPDGTVGGPSETGGAQPIRMSEVSFSALFPRRLIRDEYTVLEMFMYEEAFRHIVDEAAAAVTEELGEKKKGVLRVGENTEVTVFLKCSDPDVQIEGSGESRIWYGKYTSFDFAVFVPGICRSRKLLFTASVWFGGGLATTLRFEAACDGSQEREPEILREDVRSAFVSYASEDRAQVAARIQGMRRVRPEMDIFFDVDSMRTGETWESRLRSEIEKRDVLYLCWSPAAPRSTWVDREWHFALENKGLDSIQPLPLVLPENGPPPPKELESKFFSARELYFMGPKA